MAQSSRKKARTQAAQSTPPAPVTPPKPKRPFGVSALMVLHILGGILFFIFGVTVAIKSSYFSSIMSNSVNGMSIINATTKAAALSAIPSILLITELLFTIVGVVSIVIGIGMWKGEPWGWWLAMVLYVLDVIFFLFSLTAGISLLGIIFLVIGLLLIYYLTRPEVKAWFKM